MAAISSANSVMPLHLKKPRQVKRKSRKSETMRSRTSSLLHRDLCGCSVTDMRYQPLNDGASPFANAPTPMWLQKGKISQASLALGELEGTVIPRPFTAWTLVKEGLQAFIDDNAL